MFKRKVSINVARLDKLAIEVTIVYLVFFEILARLFGGVLFFYFFCFRKIRKFSVKIQKCIFEGAKTSYKIYNSLKNKKL